MITAATPSVDKTISLPVFDGYKTSTTVEVSITDAMAIAFGNLPDYSFSFNSKWAELNIYYKGDKVFKRTFPSSVISYLTIVKNALALAHLHSVNKLPAF